jgi:hypothetical protein
VRESVAFAVDATPGEAYTTWDRSRPIASSLERTGADFPIDLQGESEGTTQARTHPIPLLSTLRLDTIWTLSDACIAEGVLTRPES